MSFQVSESETVVNASEEDKEEEVVAQEAMQHVQHSLTTFLASEPSDSGVASLDRTPEDATAAASSATTWPQRPQSIVVTPAERFNYAGNWNNMINSRQQRKARKAGSPRGAARRSDNSTIERTKIHNTANSRFVAA